MVEAQGSILGAEPECLSDRLLDVFSEYICLALSFLLDDWRRGSCCKNSLGNLLGLYGLYCSCRRCQPSETVLTTEVIVLPCQWLLVLGACHRRDLGRYVRVQFRTSHMEVRAPGAPTY